jgi:hypothetical protein
LSIVISFHLSVYAGPDRGGHAVRHRGNQHRPILDCRGEFSVKEQAVSTQAVLAAANELIGADLL